MSAFTLKGILIRRMEYGDHDYILTFLTDERGKITVIAKNAKKSVRRFGGILELFSHVSLALTENRNKNGIPVLMEADLEHPFDHIRSDIFSTSYASYWVEIIQLWVEEQVNQEPLYHLLLYVLAALDRDRRAASQLSLLFQMKFLEIAGLSPSLQECASCKISFEAIQDIRLPFDIPRGAVVCPRCLTRTESTQMLSKGTAKLLLWLQNNDLKTAERVRYSPAAISEGLQFLETFISYYLGKEPRSLNFLRKIR